MTKYKTLIQIISDLSKSGYSIFDITDFNVKMFKMINENTAEFKNLTPDNNGNVRVDGYLGKI